VLHGDDFYIGNSQPFCTNRCQQTYDREGREVTKSELKGVVNVGVKKGHTPGIVRQGKKKCAHPGCERNLFSARVYCPDHHRMMERGEIEKKENTWSPYKSGQTTVVIKAPTPAPAVVQKVPEKKVEVKFDHKTHIEPSGAILKQGELTKQDVRGVISKSWRRRHCVIQGTVFRYYETKAKFDNNQAPIGTLPKEQLLRCHYYGSELDAGKRFDLQIRSGRQFNFRAKDPEEAQAWSQAISKLITG
jgi:hypothetical protein